ncbi:MAG: hypothetical protein GY832_08325, partial [Chloroflexi bacterium]|nr:hypothetical protein [Chloroflexota bacterium]
AEGPEAQRLAVLGLLKEKGVGAIRAHRLLGEFFVEPLPWCYENCQMLAEVGELRGAMDIMEAILITVITLFGGEIIAAELAFGEGVFVAEFADDLGRVAGPKRTPSSGPLKNASGSGNLDDAASAARTQPHYSMGANDVPGRAINRFPADPDDFTRQLGVQPSKVSTTKHGTKRFVWEPNKNTRIRYESHPGDSGPFVPRHHGEHYHIEIKPDNLTWNQAKKQGMIVKVKPENYQPGHGTGFLPDETHPGQ